MTEPEIYIYVTDQFAAFHRWTEAPLDVEFLREYHRHMFHVKVVFKVKHADREMEFFRLKKHLSRVLREQFEGKQFEFSCEQLCIEIHRFLSASCLVQVSEDGENGAIVKW